MEKKRLLGKMDVFAKVHVSGEEKFKTKIHTDGERTPVWNQAFLFNLSGKAQEEQLHVRVYDSETLSNTLIGRADPVLREMLSRGGGEQWHSLHDPDEFRRLTGEVCLSVSFSGEGGPEVARELPPVSGAFHFQHNSTGLLLRVQGDALHMQAGGLNEPTAAFEFQGPYIRSVVDSRYLTAVGEQGDLCLQAGISDAAKWKWTGLGLQHESSGRLLHPENDALQPGVRMVLLPGANAASGFSLVACDLTKSPVSASPPAATAGVSPSYPASVATPTPPAAATAAAPAPVAVVSPPPATNPQAYPSVAGDKWSCSTCTFENPVRVSVCEMCSKSRSSPSSVSVASPVFNASNPQTYPRSMHTSKHAHVLLQTPSVYQGVYHCDHCQKEGRGITYHCAACQFDLHPACAYANRI